MKSLRFISILLITGLLAQQLKAQQAVAAAGGNASGSGGSVSWTAGQTCFSTFTGLSGSVAEGVQQPYEISVINGAELPEITLQLRVFPNPTADRLMLETGGTQGVFAAALFDVQGKLLQKYRVTSMFTEINMVSYAPANYILRVTRNGRQVKSFRIIRN